MLTTKYRIHIQPSINLFEINRYAYVVQIMSESKLANLWRKMKNLKLIKHLNEEEKLHNGGKRDSRLRKGGIF